MTQSADPYNPSSSDPAKPPSNDPAANPQNPDATSPSFWSGPTPIGQMLGYAALGVGIGVALNLLLSR